MRCVKAIGVLAVVAVLASLAEGDSFAANLFSSYEKWALNDIGTPQALNSLRALYERVESEPASSGIIKDVETFRDLGPRCPSFAHTRRIPGEWIPSQLRSVQGWGNKQADKFYSSGEVDFSLNHDVLAYYNEQNQLQGIEFDGSRYGCFISRDPDMCLPWVGISTPTAEKSPSDELWKRIADKPLCVTIRYFE